MDMELIASRAILSMAAKYRADYLRNFYELSRKNIEQQPTPNSTDRLSDSCRSGEDEAVAKLVGSLIDQGVEVFRLDQELHLSYGPQVLQRTNSASEKLGTYRTVIANTTAMQEVPAGQLHHLSCTAAAVECARAFRAADLSKPIDGSGRS